MPGKPVRVRLLARHTRLYNIWSPEPRKPPSASAPPCAENPRRGRKMGLFSFQDW